MTDLMVRCTACRGTKKVTRLGGVIGDCMTCNSTGLIKACDKPVSIQQVQDTPANEIIKAVDKVKPEHDIVTVFNDDLVAEIKAETKEADNINIIKPVKPKQTEELKPHSAKAKYKRKASSK